MLGHEDDVLRHEDDEDDVLGHEADVLGHEAVGMDKFIEATTAGVKPVSVKDYVVTTVSTLVDGFVGVRRV